MPSWEHLTAVLEQRPAALLDLPLRRLASRGRRLAALYRPTQPAFPGRLPDRIERLLGEASRAPVWCNPSRRESLLAALTPDMRARVRVRAEVILGGTVQQFGHTLHLSEGGIPWDRDPRTGYRWATGESRSLRLGVPGADVKDAWALGRLDEALALAMAARIEDDPTQARRMEAASLRWAIDFLANNPPGRGVQWTCAMEVALRAVNLVQGVHLLADSPLMRAPDTVAIFAAALQAHVQFVWDHLEDDQAVPNNHLVAGLVGQLVTCTLAAGLPEARAHRRRARRRLLRELDAQVDVDGVAFEGSVPYHRLSLELFTLAFLVDRVGGARWPPWARERLTRMYEAVLSLSSSSGTAAQIGDNDSGRGLSLIERGALDVSHLPSLGAAMLETSRLKLEDDVPSDELAWLLGIEGVATFRALPARAARRSRSFPQAGLHVLSGAGATVVVSAGPQGQAGVGGHSHLDKLSFELHLHGRPCIVDAGTATYTRSPGLRNRLRSTSMHNTVQVDGEEQAPLDEARLFSLPARIGARAARVLHGESVDALSVHHDGYRRLPSPVRVWRRFLLDRTQKALAVEDLLEGEGVHVVTWRLHLAGTHARFVPLSRDLRRRVRSLPEGPEHPGPRVLCLLPGAHLIFDAALEPALEETLHSPGYGQTEVGQRVHFGARLALPRRWRWAVVWD